MSKKTRKKKYDDVVNRLRTFCGYYTGCYTDTGIANFFGISQQAVSTWRKSGVPESRIKKLVNEKDLSEHWLYSGEGEKWLSGVGCSIKDRFVGEPQATYPPTRPDTFKLPKRISLILEDAKKILESKTEYAEKLENTIGSFYLATRRELQLRDNNNPSNKD